MNIDIFRYTQSLLLNHKCISIYGLGSLIVNEIQSDIVSQKPTFTLGFNASLSHDDGILISSISQMEGISYENAKKKVVDQVHILKIKLSQDNKVQLGALGTMTLGTEKNIIFEAHPSFCLSEYYGLTNVSLYPLTHLYRVTQREESSTIWWKRSVVGVAAASVIALMLLVPSSSIKDSHNNQTAGFIHSIAINTDNSRLVAPVINDLNVVVSEEISADRTYHIIVAGDNSSIRIKNKIARLKRDGFSDLTVIKSTASKMERVSIAHFDDKDEANEYLDNFRNENPKYKDAWLYSKRNN